MNRYEKQMSFSPIGKAGQDRLGQAHVLLIGVGALGSVSAETLVRAGVKTVTIVDRDYVELSNLHRQQLYCEADVEQVLPKAIAAKRRLEEINSDARIEAHVIDATARNLEPLLSDVDILIDGTDNFDIRFIMNDLSVKHNIPWVFGACAGSYGMTKFFQPNEDPCLMCVMKFIPGEAMTCDSHGVIAPVIQQTSLMQTVHVLKWLTGKSDVIDRSISIYDIWEGNYQKFSMKKMKKESCKTCGSERTFPYLQSLQQNDIAVLCGRDTIQIRMKDRSFDLSHLEMKLAAYGKTKKNSFLLSFTEYESGKRMAIFKDGRVLVHGTKDVEEAKVFYHEMME
ncbi:ThiF family adenylyltransferase [Geomicrobium sediminis]|uniref:Adenylyltransferase/sulfurtransferase n=1 Tax=Geomicrobium sediminis TaxID=1347788 RepID=A0ABS2PA92_9BACL|nr:adenylyltransferase/sulfurtransferase [Geomicrobium sediminis]